MGKFRSNMASDIPNFLRGILMGGADIIPGVSGGTVALILGIYGRLVGAISRVDKTLIAHLTLGEWRAFAERLDLRFLVTLGAGIASGILGLASLMHYLLEQYTQQSFAAFFGLILASTWLVARMAGRWSKGLISLMAVGALGTYMLVGLPILQTPPSGNTYVFFSGVIAICAMILPGISGSFILLLLGMYSHITGLLRTMLKFELGFEGLLTIGVFVAGCATGIILFSKFLSWLLRHYYRATMVLLCGVMLGSLRKIWPFRLDLSPEIADVGKKNYVEIWPEQFNQHVALSCGIALAAFCLVFALDFLARQGFKKART